MGRPRLKPTPEQRALVEQWASFGLPHEAIARTLNVAMETLRKHYREELANGRHTANAKVAGALFNTAITGEGSSAVTAQIFWLKTRAGWKETQAIEITEKRSPEERRARLAAILERIGAADD